MLVHFEKHKGYYDEHKDIFIFYGIEFKNIFEVKDFVKYLDSNTHYENWYHRSYRGLCEMITGRIYVDRRWIPNEKLARLYLDRKSKSS